MTEERQEFTTGAALSRMKGRPDLIPKSAIDAMARRLELGTKYGENNWRLGGEDFRKATIGHLMNHLLDYMENGNSRDENSDAIICNAAFLCQYELESPYPGVAAQVAEVKSKKGATVEDIRAPYVPGTACGVCHKVHKMLNGVDTADHAYLSSVQIFQRNTEAQLDAINATIRRVLGDSVKMTNAQIADAIVKEIFL